MYYDDYSTSFQSLYSPMYNMQTNYNANTNGGAGVGAGYGGGMANMGCISPMMNVGVGQFGADQLVKGDETKNNYYAKPIAAHKKKDDVPTMLGILGTALGTTALLVALCKGKKLPWRRKPGVPTPPPAPGPTTGPTPNTPALPPGRPGPTPGGPTPGGPTPGGPTPGGPQAPIAGFLPVPTKPGAPISGGLVPIGPTSNLTPIATPITGLLPTPAPTMTIIGEPHRLPRTRLKDFAVDTPFEEIKTPLFLTGGSSMKKSLPATYKADAPVVIKGALPTLSTNAKYQQALLKQQAAMNLPSSNKVHTPIVGDQQLRTVIEQRLNDRGYFV